MCAGNLFSKWFAAPRRCCGSLPGRQLLARRGVGGGSYSFFVGARKFSLMNCWCSNERALARLLRCFPRARRVSGGGGSVQHLVERARRRRAAVMAAPVSWCVRNPAPLRRVLRCRSLLYACSLSRRERSLRVFGLAQCNNKISSRHNFWGGRLQSLFICLRIRQTSSQYASFFAACSCCV